MIPTRPLPSGLVRAVACLGLVLSVAIPGQSPVALAASPQASPAARRLATAVKTSGTVCASEAALETAIAGRVPAVRFVDTAAEVTLSVEWTQSAAGITADLAIDAEAKAPVRRRLRGTQCQSLRAAIALVAAISLEQYLAEPTRPRTAPVISTPPAKATAPTVPTRPKTQRPSEGSATDQRSPDTSATGGTETNTPLPPSAADEQPVVQILELPAAPAIEPQPPVVAPQAAEQAPSAGPQAPPKPPPKARRAQTAASLSLRVAANSSIGLTPQPLFGVGVSGLLTVPGFDGWKPQVQVGATWSPRRAFNLDTAQVDFEMQAAVVAFCPLVIRHLGWHLAPCLGAEWGALIAEGKRVFSPQRHRRNWRALTAQAQGTFPLFRTVRGFAGLGAVLPLTVDRFEVAGADTSHRPAQPVFRLVLGLDWGLI